MPLHLAWRILADHKGRTALAAGGVFVAILLIFVELGFFVAVPQGGMLIYDHLRFDLLVASSKYLFQSQSGQFPRGRLALAQTIPEVAQASALYLGAGKWQEPAGGLRLDLTVMGFDPRARIFAVPEIERQQAVLERADTVLVDSATRSLYGSLQPGRVVEIAGRRTTIGGQYTLGTGFLGLGVAVASEANFFRLFPGRPPDSVNLGLVTLRPDADPDRAARALRAVLPADTRVFTRAELVAHEVAYWTVRTATGLIFGSGLVVSFVVGIMVLYQTLATQITRQLPQFATLKAIGYSNRYLDAVVLLEALLIMMVAFLPALGAALAIYALVREETLLPLQLSVPQLGAVFGITLAMATASAFLSLGALRRADPAEIF
ncbi:MAG TPA: FtsX-like permease family protein [Stellaceae bacterium]|nr:FtsX-like permease family protein [Stellaceae bacterium]